MATNLALDPALLDRAIVSVSPAAYADFLARLDAPPQPNDRLRKSMQAPTPWSPV